MIPLDNWFVSSADLEKVFFLLLLALSILQAELAKIAAQFDKFEDYSSAITKYLECLDYLVVALTCKCDFYLPLPWFSKFVT